MQTLDPDTLARIRSLELRARQTVEGFVTGGHRSKQHGFAVEFAQHREYVPGDDIRHVDWKVYGRSERFYLKQYELETNLVLWLLVDASESMRYGSTATTKYDLACTAAASLGYLVVLQTGCRLHHIDYVELRTDKDLGLALAEYLVRRASR